MSATWTEPARPAATASPVASALPDTAHNPSFRSGGLDKIVSHH